MYRFSRIEGVGGGGNEKALSHVNAKPSGMAFVSSSIFFLPPCPSPSCLPLLPMFPTASPPVHVLMFLFLLSVLHFLFSISSWQPLFCPFLPHLSFLKFVSFSLPIHSNCFFPFSPSYFLLPLLGTLPYDIKIVIAGNHELTFDQEFMADLIKQDFYYFPSASKLKPENYENVQSLLTNCIYLQDSEVTVRGFRIYGSPWWVTTITALHMKG